MDNYYISLLMMNELPPNWLLVYEGFEQGNNQQPIRQKAQRLFLVLIKNVVIL